MFSLQRRQEPPVNAAKAAGNGNGVAVPVLACISYLGRAAIHLKRPPEVPHRSNCKCTASIRGLRCIASPAAVFKTWNSRIRRKTNYRRQNSRSADRALSHHNDFIVAKLPKDFYENSWYRRGRASLVCTAQANPCKMIGSVQQAQPTLAQTADPSLSTRRDAIAYYLP